MEKKEKKEREGVQRHESFGTVRFGHISGQKRLFGSNVEHNNWISLEIYQASIHEDSSDHQKIFPNNQIIGVSLSYAQFGQLISQNGNAQGTPCTIDRLPDGKRSAPLPPLDNKVVHMRKRVEARLKRLLPRVREEQGKIENILAKPSIGKTDKVDILKSLGRVEMEIADNLPFFFTMFQEAMEESIADAKIEIESYISQTLNHRGVKAEDFVRMVEKKTELKEEVLEISNPGI